MLARLERRGPDDQGVWNEAGAWLGHRRLSIIDLSPAGHQPMVSHDGRWVLVLNGEIYNFRALRAELDAVAWRGHSDSEVLLEAIARLGLDEALTRARGMFAFAAWDRSERTLHLARDAFGEKPLCWRWERGEFAFASTLDALCAADQVEREISTDALAHYLHYAYVDAPETILEGAQKLPPGCQLSWREGGAPSIKRWFDLDALVEAGQAEPLAGSETAIEALDGLLRAVIDDQRISDAPLGAFLSGGVDSSLIVAMLQAASDRPVETFTLGFERPDWNEAPSAAAVAAHLGTRHTEHVVSMSEAAELAPAMGAVFDEPFADASQIPTFLLSRLARRRVTVALTGDGGDEMFGGYVRYGGVPRLWSAMRRLPARRAVAGALERTPLSLIDAGERLIGPLARGYSAKGRVSHGVRRAADWLRADSFDALYERTFAHWSEPGDVMLAAARAARPPCPAPRSSALQAMIRRDTLHYLPGDILVKVDRCAMAVSLETRAPLLDPRIAAFSWRAPDALKIAPGGEAKWLLRRVLDRYVPRALIDRPKMGFSVPLADWLAGSLRPWAEDLLSPATLKRQGLLRPDAVARVWRRFLAGDESLTPKLWTVLMLQAWQAERGR